VVHLHCFLERNPAVVPMIWISLARLPLHCAASSADPHSVLKTCVKVLCDGKNFAVAIQDFDAAMKLTPDSDMIGRARLLAGMCTRSRVCFFVSIAVRCVCFVKESTYGRVALAYIKRHFYYYYPSNKSLQPRSCLIPSFSHFWSGLCVRRESPSIRGRKHVGGGQDRLHISPWSGFTRRVRDQILKSGRSKRQPNNDEVCSQT